MQNANPWLLFCGICCGWPLLIGVLPTFLIMRYGIRFRLPFQVTTRTIGGRHIVRPDEERIGFR